MFAYIHVPKDKWNNLKSKSIKGIFVGYNLQWKAYRIYINEGRQIEFCRDVIFDENHAYKISKDIPIEFDEEDVPLFEEEEKHEKSPTNQEEEGPSEAIKHIIIPEANNRPNWLK